MIIVFQMTDNQLYSDTFSEAFFIFLLQCKHSDVWKMPLVCE